jgi:hypothetical protein
MVSRFAGIAPVLAIAALDQVVEKLRGLDLLPLPRGAAPVVMIFGGITVMGTALALAILEPRPAPGSRERGGVASPVRWAPVEPPRFEEGLAAGKGLAPLNWSQVLLDAADLGLGEPRQGPSGQAWTRMRLGRCRTCRLHPRAPEAGCAYERGFLEGAAAQFAPGWTVVEVRCGRGLDGLCEFELRGA